MRSLFTLALSVLAGLAMAGPKILIVQPSDEAKFPLAGQLVVGDYIASVFSDGGKTTAIVYGMTDPVFRAAVLDGGLKVAPENPTLAQALEVGRALGVDYVLACHAVVKGGQVRAAAKLYRAGRPVWTDEASMGVKVGEKNSDGDAARSVAQTWLSKLMMGPFKSSTAAQVNPTPDPTSGQIPVVVEVPPEVPKVDDAALGKQFDILLNAGQTLEALLAARDAVDEVPLDTARRKLLVKVLRVRGEQQLAAEELQRAADLAPEDLDLRLAAARSWLDLRNYDAARSDFNEVVARNPSSPATRQLLGELNLIQGEPDTALPHFDAAINGAPSFSGYFERAICRALLGGSEGVALDLSEAAKQTPPSRDEAKRLGLVALRSFDTASGKASEDLKTLISHAGIKPKDVGVREDMDTLTRQAKSRKAFLEAVAIDLDLKDARNRFALVQSLLLQSLLSVQAFVAGGTDDDLTDARINLSEAIKQIAVARESLGKVSSS